VPIRRRHRHQHDWEVVEKTVIEGLPLEEAVRAAEAATGQMIVHYRCMCGADKVERI
jgi:predicted SprT family Zn-dependent metalloprotease